MAIKLIVLGLDGATFDIIDGFKDHEIPYIKKIIKYGVRGDLESTFPPVTGPAWFSCATGKNPGKTGVFEFFNRTNPESFETHTFTSSKFRQIGSYWDYLSQAGKKVGIWNYPKLYPPYSLNGFMTSGFTASPDDGFTYPANLKKQLLNICPGYKIHIPIMHPRYNDNPQLLSDDLLELLNQNEKTLDYLLKQELDVFVGVIAASDFAQHAMWKYIDSNHPLYDDKKAAIGKPLFLQIWQKIDSIVGQVLSKAEKANANILLISDHGFGSHAESFYTNLWLESEGYLTWNRSGTQGIRYFLAKAILKTGLKSNRIPKIVKKRGKKDDKSLMDRIDLSKTLAFAGYHSSSIGNIYINTSEESPLKSEDEFNVVKEEIISKLRETCNRLNMDINIYYRDDIYDGKFTTMAPPVLFSLSNFACSVHPGYGTVIHKNVPHKPNHAGSHRMNGIFVAYGPDIGTGTRIDGARIYDIAPTVLHLMGLPVPDDMDGVVLKEIFKENTDIASQDIRHLNVARTSAREKIRKLKHSNRLK